MRMKFWVDKKILFLTIQALFCSYAEPTKNMKYKSNINGGNKCKNENNNNNNNRRKHQNANLPFM